MRGGTHVAVAVVLTASGCEFGATGPGAASGAGLGEDDGDGDGDGGSSTGEIDDGGIPNPTSVASGDAGGSSDDGDGGSGGSTGDAPCPAGTQGCPCDGRTCDDGLVCDNEQCIPVECGNRRVDAGEQCDDGNRRDDDGCDSDCTASLRARRVVAGTDHTCALLHDGRVRCWGLGEAGQLGLGSIDDVGLDEVAGEADDVDVGGAAIDLCAGSNFTCAVLDGGDARCWGGAGAGRLGNVDPEQNIGDDEAPSDVPPIDLGGPATQIACGAMHACAVLDGGDVRCWGEAMHGRLGYGVQGNVGDDEPPSSVPPVDVGGMPVVQVAAAAEHTCARLQDGGVLCWGRAADGRLGNGSDMGNLGDNEPPSDGTLVPLPAPAIGLVAGDGHSCAMIEGGALRCWGRNNKGQLGYGDTEPVGGPDLGVDEAPNVDLDGAVADVALGNEHTCAVVQTGAVRCWGEGDGGRLGSMDTTDLLAPPVIGIDLGPAAIDLASGGGHSCARIGGGRLRCWGRFTRGQLGYGPAVGEDLGDDEPPGSAGDVPFL